MHKLKCDDTCMYCMCAYSMCVCIHMYTHSTMTHACNACMYIMCVCIHIHTHSTKTHHILSMVRCALSLQTHTHTRSLSLLPSLSLSHTHTHAQTSTRAHAHKHTRTHTHTHTCGSPTATYGELPYERARLILGGQLPCLSPELRIFYIEESRFWNGSWPGL